MTTSIIPSIPLYTTHYPLPLYQAATNVPAAAPPTNLTTLSDATALPAATANTPTSVGSLIDLTA